MNEKKGKSKFDYEIEEFHNAFHNMKDKKIALYGTGRMTATLVAGVGDYQIIGLCDRDESLIGKEVYGKPVLSRKQAEEQADLLVINTDATYWNAIYKRIQDWNIPIYFRNGVRAFLEVKEDKENPYWQKSLNELKSVVQSYEVISFDIVDTLLIRKVMSPFDVFRIVELRLQSQYGEIDFCGVRKRATSMLEQPTYDEIYAKISETSGWDLETVETAKRLEQEIEKSLLVARNDVAGLCNEIMQEKEVYFVSDMYFTKETLWELLTINGINAKREQIIVSCELRKDKKSGELWQWYKDDVVKERRALHIGDNLKSDVDMPRKYGIESYYVMSVNEMLEHSSIKDIVPNIVSVQSSLAMGMVCAKVFNSPFALNASFGKLVFHDNREAGYVLLGNLVYNFMLWLINNAKADGVEQLLFVAREGYLLVPQYQHMRKLLEDTNAPKGIYLEISRRAIWGASIENIEDVYEIATFPYGGTCKEFLKDRFGVAAEDEDLDNKRMAEVQSDPKQLRAFVEKYADVILSALLTEKTNYKTYTDGMNLGERIGVVDSLWYGSTQYYLSKFLKQKVHGYYFTACLDESNRYIYQNDMKGCFQRKEDLSGKECSVFRNSKFMEAFFTAPNGMLICINSDGTPKHSEPMSNQLNYSVRLDMQEGILEFFFDMVKLQNRLGLMERLNDELFSDELFDVLMNNGFEPTEEMKKGFYFDNKILNDRESRIWE
ncbi:MAG: hypothetical protein E7292_04595 [Lachnospiraceae bacterium]|nr:hypothetical protein [Lachnospiraceae bacterium]